MAVEHIRYTDTLRQGADKINAAIDQSNDAIEKATTADANASQALALAQNVQTQLDTIVIEGDSSVEAAQARVDAEGRVFTTLKERLDTKETQFKQGIEELQQNIENFQLYNVKSFGAVGDGVTDDSAAIADAIAACPPGGKLVFPHGTYKCTVKIDKPITIDFMGSKLIPVDGVSFIVQATGTESPNKYVLASPVQRGDTVLSLTTTPTDISAGDLIVLCDDTVRESDSTPNVNQEVHLVKSVSGSDIVLVDFVRLPKTVSTTANVYKIAPIQGITIKNINLEAVDGATHNNGLFFDGCRDIVVENVTMTNSVAPCVDFRRSYNCIVKNFRFSDPQATGSGHGYGIAFSHGTMRGIVQNGHCDGMRHAVDCGNCFDIVVSDVLAVNNASTPFVISHNGWDSDITFIRCVAIGGDAPGFLASAQGKASDPYSLTCYNVKLIDCQTFVSAVTSINGVYFQMPVQDLKIDGMFIQCGDGTTIPINSSGLRFMAVDNSGIIRNVKIHGFLRGIMKYHSTSKTPNNEKDRLIFQNITIKNCNIGIFLTYAFELHAENVIIDGIKESTIFFDYTASGTKLRYLTLKNIELVNYTPGRLFNLSDFTNVRHASGIIGELSNLHANTTTFANKTVANGDTITLEDILLNKDGQLIRLASSSAVTLGTNPLPQGLVEGQTLILVSMGNDITIPNGAYNLNDGASNITIGPANRGVSYVWTTNQWVQI